MNTTTEAAFIYNVTTQVAHVIKNEWVQWMKEKHIPEIMQTGCFIKYQFVQILELDETDGITYAVQYYAASKALYNQYIEKYAPALRQDVLQTWGNKIVGFRSLMQCI